jgi:hypothetical protein
MTDLERSVETERAHLPFRWRIVLPFGVLLLLTRATALADAETAFWAEFNWTPIWKKNFVMVISPSYRSDEQEVDGGGITRVTFDSIVGLPREWEVRGRFFLIGRDKEVGGAAFDQRIQIRVRHPLGVIERIEMAVLGGMVYERHFRGDEIADFNVYRPRVDWTARTLKWRLVPWGQQDFSFDHARGFFRTRTRVGLLKDLKRNNRIALAYQFQYTQDLTGSWTPQHAVFCRYWFGRRLRVKGRGGVDTE